MIETEGRSDGPELYPALMVTSYVFSKSSQGGLLTLVLVINRVKY